jgi:transposase
MYIRTSVRHNKNGSQTRYIQLVQNVWDANAGRSVPHIVYNFGREDELDKEDLRRLARNIGHYLGEPFTGVEGAGTQGLRYIGSKALGGVWVLNALWERLGIKKALAGLLEQHHYQSPVERALFALVANRALAPVSKLAVEEWVAEEVAVPGLAEVAVQQLYRAMDFLLEHQDELQWQVYTSVADLLNLEVDILYFDTTSTYFETEDEDEEDTEGQGLRKRGYSKDHRPDLPQAVIGLAVTKDGIPVRCWVWPGNTADMSVVGQVKKDLIGWKLGRVITVVDRGFVSEENLKELQKTGGHYIAGEKLRSGKAETAAALGRAGRYQWVKEGVEVKEILVGEGEARQRYVVVRNQQRAERDRTVRADLLSRLEGELKQIKVLKGKPHTKACCALLANSLYSRYLKTNKQGQPRIDRRKVREEAKLDGRYLIRTSDDTLSAEQVALGYRQLAEVESAFRSLKHELDLRPIYHRLEERIRSHILLCWLALLLIRVAENRTGETWSLLRRQLNRMRLGEFGGSSGRVLQRSEPSPYHQTVFKAMGLPLPPQVFLAETPAVQSAA